MPGPQDALTSAWRLSRVHTCVRQWRDARRALHTTQRSSQAEAAAPPSPTFPAETTKPAATPPPKPGSGIGLALLATAVSVAGGVYYYYTFFQDPTIAPHPAQPVTSPVTLLDPPPKLTVQQELELRRDMLRAELEHLRTQKRTKYIDSKKRDLKNELKDLDAKIRKLSL